jgi:SET domain
VNAPPVREGPSPINRVGVFANQRFSPNQRIGQIALGAAVAQGEHTVAFRGQHYDVKAPWRYLNHGCSANARLEVADDGMFLVATVAVLPQDELTIDYRLLSEGVTIAFTCRCTAHAQPVEIGPQRKL